MNSRGVELVNVAPYMREKTKLKELADKAEVPADNAERLIVKMVDDKNGHKREPKPPAPEDGISQSEAGRIFKVPQQTISRWYKKGYIPRINHPSKKEIYLDKSALIERIKIYKKDPGQGKRTLKQSQNAS